MCVVVFGITAMVWSFSAEHEHRWRMPEKGRFFPSRQYAKFSIIHADMSEGSELIKDSPKCSWSKQIIEYERAEAAKEAAAREK